MAEFLVETGLITDNFKVVFNKSEREYIPYDLAKKYMEQLANKLSQQQSTYVVTIQKLEDKYRQIELEANGHFTDFVTDIKSKYKVKIDTFRTLMAVHKKELEKKQLEWEGGMKTLKNKNGHLNEQRKCLLLAYKKIKGEKDEQIRILREENEKLRRELQEAASKAPVTIEKPTTNEIEVVKEVVKEKEVIVEKIVEVPIGAAAATGAVIAAKNDDELQELKRQIDDLKTQLASAQAGTVRGLAFNMKSHYTIFQLHTYPE